MFVTLRAARVNKNLRQMDAAKLLGISESTLLNYEKGRTFPSQPTIKKMEDLYGVSYNNIIFLSADNG